YTPEQPATFRYAGVSYEAKVRLRGASARTFPKKSWNVDIKGKLPDGRGTLNLIAEFQDSTMMAEKLAYDVLEALGAPSPKAKFVRVFLNGKFQGVYVDLEQVNKTFLKSRGMDADGTVFRTGWKDNEFKTYRLPYQGDWKKKTNEKQPGREDLEDFLRVLNYTPEPDFAAALGGRFELDWYLRSMTMDALMSNNYIEDSESYVIRDHVSGKWFYVPWDLNNVDARWWPTYALGMKPISKHPLWIFSLTDNKLQRIYDSRKGLYPGYQPVFSNLNTRIALNPALREQVSALVEQALGDFFNPAVLEPRIDAMRALIAADMAKDPYIDQAKWAAGTPFLKQYVRERVPFLRSELARYRTQQPALVIERFDPQQGWVELRNRSASPVNVGGMTLTNNLRKPMLRNLRPRTIQPGETVRYTARQLNLTFAPEGEVGLFDGRTEFGMKDALFYGRTPAGTLYARNGVDPKRWEVRAP
ncbi:MAG TPA: CotH kinase family protein, partial [Myxococcaceae bacterium]|nr:CotH kinase family protein [Myxococcaceae bacterium]